MHFGHERIRLIKQHAICFYYIVTVVVLFTYTNNNVGIVFNVLCPHLGLLGVLSRAIAYTVYDLLRYHGHAVEVLGIAYLIGNVVLLLKHKICLTQIRSELRHTNGTCSSGTILSKRRERILCR